MIKPKKKEEEPKIEQTPKEEVNKEPEPFPLEKETTEDKEFFYENAQ